MLQFNYPLDQPIEGSWEIIIPVYGEDDLECLRQFLSSYGFPSYESMSMSVFKKDRMINDNSVAIRLTCGPEKMWDMAGSGWCDLNWYLSSLWRNCPVLRIHELFSQDAVPADEVNMESLLEMI